MPPFNPNFPQQPFNYDLEIIKNQIHSLSEQIRKIERRISLLEKSIDNDLKKITPTPMNDSNSLFSNDNYTNGNYIL